VCCGLVVDSNSTPHRGDAVGRVAEADGAADNVYRHVRHKYNPHAPLVYFVHNPLVYLCSCRLYPQLVGCCLEEVSYPPSPLANHARCFQVFRRHVSCGHPLTPTPDAKEADLVEEVRVGDAIQLADV